MDSGEGPLLPSCLLALTSQPSHLVGKQCTSAEWPWPPKGSLSLRADTDVMCHMDTHP